MNCYTISPSQPFISSVARWVLDQYGHSPERLTKTRILLPGRRACRSLQEAFLALSEGKPLLLPRIEPIGECALPSHYAAGRVIAPLRRHLLLAQMIANFERQRQGRIYNMEKAMQLAGDLARFMDEVAICDLDYSGLKELVPEELEEHWQQTVDFLGIISSHWPQILKEEGAQDPAEYRSEGTLELAASWQAAEPDYPIIAAGSTGSQPATAHLLSVIAGMKQGMVIFPGLDKQMEDECWDTLEETHPQYLLKQLCEKIGCARGDVQWLSEEKIEPAKTLCMRQLFSPVGLTASWKEADIPLEEGFSHIRVMETKSELEEARLIGVLLRETLEGRARTAALITPDRTLARLVSAQMQRYDIAIDDSAGRSLKSCPVGVYMRLICKAFSSRFAPADLLALLRHPLAAAGMEPADCRTLSRKLELQCLRGVRMQSGLGALCNAVKEQGQEELAEFLEELKERAGLLTESFSTGNPILFADILQQHIEFAEWLASTPIEPGDVRLWQKESGNHMASLLTELMEYSEVLDAIDPLIYPATFEALLAIQTYWPKQTAHPRLHILSPIEARLGQYDLIILGSMNEGQWPARASADPWMSRPMRQTFGLPLPERSLGQAAHDVYMASFAPEVVCTRAQKVAGTPTIASRWLVRLKTLVGGKDDALYQRLSDLSYYAHVGAVLDAPQHCDKLEAPAPVPPAHTRPARLSVTQIDTWRADPYVVYARHILGFRAQDALDREPSPADFGNVVHKALQDFVTLYPEEMPANAEKELLICGQAAFGGWLSRPAIYSLWWPRFKSLAAWFVAQEAERRKLTENVLAELQGRWDMVIEGKPFALITRIDRLEVRRDGSLALVDYKTGRAPSLLDIQKGKKNQLPLEALVVQHGSLQVADALSQPVGHFEYWKLGSQGESSEIQQMELTQEDSDNAEKMLRALIEEYDQPGAAYRAQKDPRLQLEYNDYEHLTRRKEWGAL